MERRVLTPSPEGLAVDLLSTLNKMCSNLLSALNEYVYICCIINKIKYG